MFPHTRSVLSMLMMFALLFSASNVSAKKVAGVQLSDTLAAEAGELVLNGAGLRKKLFIKLYVGSLYVPEASKDAAAIIEADEPMAVVMNILSGLLTRDKMLAALKDGFKKSTGGDTASIQPQIDQLIGLMQDKIEPGDSFVLQYEPGIGTNVSKNGEAASVIEGLEFKQALFGIWLSDKPVQSSLKKAMLGG